MPNHRSREFFAGFRSTAWRTAVLGAGWSLLALALGGVAFGLVLGNLASIGAGVVAAVLGWVVSALVPEPVPAPRMDVQRRLEQIRKLDGHQLPA